MSELLGLRFVWNLRCEAARQCENIRLEDTVESNASHRFLARCQAEPSREYKCVSRSLALSCCNCHVVFSWGSPRQHNTMSEVVRCLRPCGDSFSEAAFGDLVAVAPADHVTGGKHDDGDALEHRHVDTLHVVVTQGFIVSMTSVTFVVYCAENTWDASSAADSVLTDLTLVCCFLCRSLSLCTHKFLSHSSQFHIAHS